MKSNQKGFSLVEGLLIFIAVALIGFIGFYVYSANKKSNDSLKSADNASQQVPATSQPQNQEQAEAQELIDYGENGVEIEKKSDVDKLEGASESFKSFIASQVSDEGCRGDEVFGSGEEVNNIVGVRKIYKDSIAIGGAGGCGGGGGVNTWIKQNDKWSSVEGLGGHEAPSCSNVKKHNVPAVIIEKCYDRDKLIKNPN